jgi:hypothetical protein
MIQDRQEVFGCFKTDIWVANSTVEYSAFNRLVLGSNPRRPI